MLYYINLEPGTGVGMGAVRALTLHSNRPNLPQELTRHCREPF